MTSVQCANCQNFISADGDGRLPPWCPCCGVDLNRRTPTAAASPAALPATQGSSEEPVTALPAEPPAVLPARQPQQPIGGYQPHPDETRKPSGSSAAARAAAAVCTALGVSLAFVVAPHVFPQPEGGFSVQQVVLAGILGGVGGAVGWLIGQIIDAGRS